MKIDNIDNIRYWEKVIVDQATENERKENEFNNLPVPWVIKTSKKTCNNTLSILLSLSMETVQKEVYVWDS